MRHGRGRVGRSAIVAFVAFVLAGCENGQIPTPAPSPSPSPSPNPSPNPSPPPGEVFTTTDGIRYVVEPVASGLVVPWALAFAPDGRLFVTERPGRVRVVANGVLVTEPALTLPDVAAENESGLMGIALHPRFDENRFVYVVYTAAVPGRGAVNRVTRFREVGGILGEAAVILDDIPAASIHDGARLQFGPDEKLYLTMGDAANPSTAQDLASLNGKIFRMNDDGTRPADNPLPSLVYSYGHRNPQGLDWHPQTGHLWATEHGQTGNDELNLILPGRNYGWPVIEGGETRPNMEAPVLFFSPSIAPSGAAFYRGTRFPGFAGNLFFATLAGRHLHRVRFDGSDPRRVAATERLLPDRFGRLRAVTAGPDGALYFSTSNRDGRATPAADDDRVLRIVPAP